MKLKKKQRLLYGWGVFGVVVVALCAVGTWLLLREDGEKTTAEGMVAGVTNVLRRGIPAGAPHLRFERVAIAFRHFPGVRTRRLPEDMGSGVAMDDFDGDGLPDLFFVNLSPLGEPDVPCALFANRGDFQFEAVDTPLPALHGMGVAHADFDADGDFDLYVTGYGRNVLLRNDGGFHFTDVTAAAGVGGGGYSAGACWGDADGDGDLDLYVCRYVEFDESAPISESRRGASSLPATLNPSVYPAQSNLLYLNEGDGTFREAAAEWGVANEAGKSLGAVFADFDGDGVLDLYVANDVTDNVMYRGHRGQPFEDVSHVSCTADWRGAMGLAPGDPDGDGDLDLFITHWKPEENALYVREEGMVFRDDSVQTYLGPPGRGNIGWACDFADFDLDGRPDVYVVNGSTFEMEDAPQHLVPMLPQLFWNGGHRFFDLAPRAGEALQRPFVGRGGTSGDLDGDGDIDLVFVAHGEEPLVLRNDTEPMGNGLTVVVRGSAPNLFAYGATVTVEVGGRKHVQLVGGRVSYLSSGPHELRFGLGSATRADRVTVRFPSGNTVMRNGARGRLVVKEVDARTLGPRMDVARDALARGDTATATRVLREILALDPLHPGALYLLALHTGPAEALTLCNRLISVEPMAGRAHVLRAKILSDPRQPDLFAPEEALASIARARKLNREETGAALEEGRIRLLQGRLEEAAEVLEHMRANPRAAALAALCRYRLGQPERAARLLEPRAAPTRTGGAEEGGPAAHRMGARDPLAQLIMLGRSDRWRLVRLPLPASGGDRCALVDRDGDGQPDAQVGDKVVILAGLDPKEVRDAPPIANTATPLRPSSFSFAEAAAFALEPPARCDGPPPGATAVCEADADGDGDLDLFIACGGDDPATPLPWWVLLKEADGYRPVRGSIPAPGFCASGIAAADLDGDGRAEVLLKGGGRLPGDVGEAYLASLK